MTLWPDAVVVDGASLPLAGVLSDLHIHHGRQDLTSDFQAATCQLSLRDVSHEYVKAFQVGKTVQVTAIDGGASWPRFTGRLTDAVLEIDELTMIATGLLATLGRYVVGTVDWPVETWDQRVQRLFSEAGLEALLELRPDPEFNPNLAARTAATAGPTTVGDYLRFLAPMVGAAVADTLDGRVLVQTLGSRTLDNPVALPPAQVAYAPAWTMVLPLGNVVHVRYTGDQSMTVTATEQASVDLFGERHHTIDTSIVDAADAQYRAETFVQVAAWPRWNMYAAPVLEGLELEVGAAVYVSSMPAASPYHVWTPIVEGWTDDVVGDEWTMELGLSDPALSGLATLPWADVTAGYTWATIDQTVAWYQALTNADLAP